MSSSPKVNFLIAGVQKGGTTILDHYLRHHPEVCMANKKEVHFFDNEKLFSNQEKPDYSLYHQNFNIRDKSKILGESTPIYTYWKPAVRRIWDYNPEMKFIILLRNPIERAYSHWNKETINFHSYANQQSEAVETLSFYDAILSEKERSKSALPLQHRYYSYLDRGLYSIQIKRILSLFPPQQLLILKSDWLRNDTEKTLTKVYEFLRVKHKELPIIKTTIRSPEKLDNKSPVDSPNENLNNVSHYREPMSKRSKEYLQKFFKEDLKELEKLLNWDCSNWLL